MVGERGSFSMRRLARVWTGRGADGLVALGLVVVAIAGYVKPLFLGQTFVLRDHLTLTIPSRSFLAESLSAGHVPQWWPGVGLGVPFAANPLHGVWYPPLWPIAVLPMPFAADLLIVLHVLVGGLGIAALARRWGADPTGAAFAGAVFMTAGYTGSMAVNGVPLLSMVWIPWVLWALDRALRAEERAARVRETVCAAVLIAIQISSGDPAGAVTTALLVPALALARSARPSVILRTVPLAYAGAFALASHVVLPAIRMIGESDRAGGIDPAAATAWSMHPLRLVNWVWPRAFGNPTEGPSLDIARVWIDTGRNVSEAASWAVDSYLGLPVLFCAVVAAIHGGKSCRRLLAASGGFVLLAWGDFTPVYGWYRDVFPPEQVLRYPARHVAGALVIWCVLAGVGITILRNRRPGKRLLAASGGVALLSLSAVAIAAIARTPVARRLGERAGNVAFDAVGAWDLVIRGGAVAAAVCVVFLAAVYLARSRKFGGAAISVAAMTVVAHLICEASLLQTTLDRGRIRRAPPLLQPIRGDSLPAAAPRLYRHRSVAPVVDRVTMSNIMAGYLDTGVENVGTLHGVAHFPGYDPGVLARLKDLWLAGSDRGMRLLAIYDVGYVVLPASTAGVRGLEAVSSQTVSGLALYRVRGTRPRAFFTSDWRPVADEQLERLVLDVNNPLGRVFVASPEAGSRPRGDPEYRECDVRMPVPERVIVECESANPGYAVLLDSWAPGWSATVDGKTVEVERIDAVARGVFVTPGRHRIEFVYRTPGLRPGLVVSGVAWLGLCALGLAARRKRRHTGRSGRAG